MFSRFLFTVTLFLLPFLSEAKIVETAHVADAIEFIDEDTWFLVDLDNTMFEAKQALGHANWFYDEMQQRMQKGISSASQCISFVCSLSPFHGFLFCYNSTPGLHLELPASAAFAAPPPVHNTY